MGRANDVQRAVARQGGSQPLPEDQELPGMETTPAAAPGDVVAALPPLPADVAVSQAATAGLAIRQAQEPKHGLGLLDTLAFTEHLANRRVVGPGGPSRPMNLIVPDELHQGLTRYCAAHHVSQRLVVTWLLRELVGEVAEP